MRIQLFNSTSEISQADWFEVADPDFPFLSYPFLHALESTECLGRRTGWAPVIVTAWEGKTLQGALAAFVKNNSYGEYIFDFAWANASQNNGIPYYPKLVLAAPFTPATGPKILLRTTLDSEHKIKVASLLLQALKETGQTIQTHSSHALFIRESEQQAFRDAGYFIRHSFQYHWQNQHYSSFENFLSKLKGKRRREINRERAQVLASGVSIRRLTGADLTPTHAKLFYRFYSDTVDKRGGHEYLTAEFFDQVFAAMKNQILFVLAEDPTGKAVAGSLFYFGTETLFGRHWGCLEEYRALHFELCYYQGIEFAIERGFKLFEAGAQGEHKFNRGFLPMLTLSAHKVDHPGLSEMIVDYCEREKIEIARALQEYAEHTPFQNDSK